MGTALFWVKALKSAVLIPLVADAWSHTLQLRLRNRAYMQVTWLTAIIYTTGYWVAKVGALERQVSTAFHHVDLKSFRMCRSKVCSTVQKFPAWHTKAAPNGKMLWWIYSAIYELLVHRCEKCVEIKGDYVEK